MVNSKEKIYKNAVALLTSSSKFYINLGLERISAILELLDNPQDTLNFIHVAGTNGKGSVCAILASILDKASKKVGLYSSPHIYEYTERIKINGQDISKNDFSKLIFEICELADKHDIHLTEFEILTAVMFKYFAQNQVEVVVLETGLGGRFDATNVIKKNLCSIITHIDFDHTERLGDTIEKITFEKEGIIKNGCPVLRASEITPQPMEFSLKGIHQNENVTLAVKAVKLLFPEIGVDTIEEGLKNVKHPARFQIVNENLIVDGAHNLNGILALKESLDVYYPGKKRRFVFGCLNNKDYRKMMEALFTRNDEIYFCRFNSPNSCTFEQLQSSCAFKAQRFESLEKLPQKDVITVVCGSIYMIGDIIPRQFLLQ